MGDKVKQRYFDARFCPQCGARSHVYDCRNEGINFARFRKCRECDYLYKTHERTLKLETV